MSVHPRATLAAVVASVGAFLFGLDIGYIAPILECGPFKRDVAHLPNWAEPTSRIPSITEGFIVGVFSLGCIFMSMPGMSNHFADSWGRRSTILVGAMLFSIGCGVQARAMSVNMMIIGRFVSGCSIGLMSSVVPLYQAEVAPPSIRGMLTSLYQLMITVGIFVAALVDNFLVWREDGWRVAIWFQIIPAVVIIVVIPFLPSSPHWLVQQGLQEEAKQTLLQLRNIEDASEEFNEIVLDFHMTQALGEVKWSEVFTGRIGKLVAVGAILQMLQQLSGMNCFMYFGPRIFGSAGLPQNLSQTLINAANCIATFPALYFVDTSGRRVLLLIGAMGMVLASFSMGLIGLVFMMKIGGEWYPTNDAVGGMLGAMVTMFVISFACSWGPMVWVYCAEIFPLKYRARCIAVTTTINWIGNFIIAQFTPILLDILGFNTFFIFGFFSLLALALALWLPETKGLLLEHIGQLFDPKFKALTDGASTYGTLATPGRHCLS